MRVTRLVQTHIPVYKTKKTHKNNPFLAPIVLRPTKVTSFIEDLLIGIQPFSK